MTAWCAVTAVIHAFLGAALFFKDGSWEPFAVIANVYAVGAIVLETRKGDPS